MSDAYTVRSASQVQESEPHSVEETSQLEGFESDGDLANYREFVDQIATAADGRVILNRSAAHAAIIVEYLFRTATREVNILTGRLFERVYGAPGVVAAALAFFRDHPAARLCIVSEEPIDQAHPLMSALKKVPSISERIDHRILKSEVAKATPYHFAVADGSSFRFEREKTAMEAIVQFGEKAVGQKLNSTFRSLYAQSLPA
jgi:hypothetical protein